jgi:hypothetical protein
MKNIDLQKSANDLAFETLTLTGPAFDTAVAAKAESLAIVDPQYTAFKNAVGNFRRIYAGAATADDQAAARVPKVVAPTAPVAPAAPEQSPAA